MEKLLPTNTMTTPGRKRILSVLSSIICYLNTISTYKLYDIVKKEFGHVTQCEVYDKELACCPCTIGCQTMLRHVNLVIQFIWMYMEGVNENDMGVKVMKVNCLLYTAVLHVSNNVH